MKRVTILLLALLIAACSQGVTDLTTAKKKVADYYESGKITEEISEKTSEALEQIAGMDLSGKTAAILDVDETALSNYKHIKKISFGYDPGLWHEWVLKEEADAIAPVKELYDSLTARNVHIFFITGRKHNEYQATYDNLKAEGYTTFDTLIVRSEEEHSYPAGEYKPYHRKRISDEGFNIIMSVGDQWSDLEGGNTGIKVKIPNYLYQID